MSEMETINLGEAGRASLWYPGSNIGYLGNFYAQSSEIAKELLTIAQNRFTVNGASTIYGPINGSIWNQYRFVTSGFTNKPFLFEPFNPECYPKYFLEFGFEQAASYESSILKTQEKYSRNQNQIDLPPNIELTSFDEDNALLELESMHEVACESFNDNLLYTSISKQGFIDKYKPLVASLDPRLVVLAKEKKETVGFLFAIPYDFSRNCRTVVLKTLCHLKDAKYKGLSFALTSACHLISHNIGYTRAVHALYETDDGHSASNKIPQSKVLRKYSLFKKNI
ncbi:MAG: hypothetical protein SFY67_04770 [Candidatus Melainabacteria bacterium]|nr:hypothetical protein [Candidatus Melainabacteria bacterium]